MLDPRIIPVPKKWNHERTVFEIKEFFPELAEMEPSPSKGRIVKIQIFCAQCGKFHFIRWNEMQQAIRKGARSFDDVVIAFADKYCVQHVHIPPEEKPANLQKAEVLAEKLNAMHPEVYVREIIPQGRGYFAMKIETPIGVYLDEGTEKDWIKLVERDIKAASDFSCPFCNAKMPWTAEWSLRCEACGAYFRHNGEDLIADLDIESIPPDMALTILSKFDSCFEQDHKHAGWWGRLPDKVDPSVAALVAELEKVSGPNKTPASLEMPILCNVEDMDEETTEACLQATDINTLTQLIANNKWALQMVTCQFCNHTLAVPDFASGFNEDLRLCANPLIGKDLSDALNEHCSGDYGQFELQREREYSGYDKEVEGILWNAVVYQALEPLVRVDDLKNPRLEAQVGEPFSNFFGPICRDFTLIDEHISLDGEPFDILPLRAMVHFGVVDLERKAKERTEAKKKLRWKEIRERIEKGGHAKALKVRIESGDIDKAVGKQLIALLEDIVPVDLRREGETCAKLNQYLDLSHTAAAKIEAKLVERAWREVSQ